MKHHQLTKVFSLALTLALVTALIPAPQPTLAAPAAELFFSEYIEGSSNNKALEIFNGTGENIDLAAGAYKVQMYFNGNASPGLTVNLNGTVAAGDVFVLAHSSAVAEILAQANQTSGAGFFNGDDAVVLVKDTQTLDVIGQIGTDPGSQWGSDLESTQDNTLQRKAATCAGDTDGSDPFDPALEWDGFTQNTFDGLGVHISDCSAAAVDPKINEFSASTTGTDVEYVEIIGTPDSDYSEYSVLELEGDSGNTGVVDEVILVGSTDANGIYLASLPANALENGSLTLLLVKNFSSSSGTDLDTDDDGVFDVVPWEAIVDCAAVNDGGSSDIVYGLPVLGRYYDGASYAPGGASRIPDGFDTETDRDWVRNDFDLAGIPGYTGSIEPGEAYNTPGAPNAVYIPPAESCGDPFTPIYVIQGNEMLSAMDGNEVATEGIVVGDFQTGGKGGFYIQDASGDGDPATSDGIFVYHTSTDVNVGNHVRVRGIVDEYYDLTEVTAVSQVWNCSTGNSLLPTTISLPVTSLEDLEIYEGMLVALPQTLYISEYYNYDRYGEIVLSTSRQFTPTSVVEPGPDAIALAGEYVLNRITLDDGRTYQNPDPALHPNGGVFDLTNLFRGGDTLQNVTGILDYSHDLYRIQPTQGADYTVENTRPENPEDVGGRIKVASFNVLNYFTTLNSRGANTPEEFNRQRTKIIAAIAAMNADVVGLLEIENNTEAIQDLVTGLNDAMGADTYAFVNTGVIGQDEIKVAFIYKPAAVSLVGDYAVLDSSIDPRFIDSKNRPALAQTFMENSTGGMATVVINHLKSKGSSCEDIGDPDIGDGAGNCNLTRTAAAEALVDWLASDPTNSGDSDFLILGDLNSYDKEDPIDAIRAGSDDIPGTDDDYTDMNDYFKGEYAYSYVFDGKLGYLDHALANNELLDEITGITEWHINADEPDLLDYDMDYKEDAQDAIFEPNAFRSSDHDPIIIGLNLCDEIAPTLEVTVTPDTLWPANHKYVEVTAAPAAADNFDPNPTVSLVSVTSNEPDNGTGDGNTINDIVILDDTTILLRAERSMQGSGRIYTLTYMAVDACGNETYTEASVVVPLNRKNK
ncbi:MAG: ExeM/NucH family extracellular endonuclease [Anaerolineales bacterium]|nr:ExeM/NucH family extracellular endonuclease [Anaerolineales bacterium]